MKASDGTTLPCHWYENPDTPGELFLVPCCEARVQDPDTDCTCELPIDELARLRREIAEVRRQLTDTTRQLHDLSAAVSVSPDALNIYARADSYRAARKGITG
ncbi:hypothetical protein ACQP25_44375 (plasmid) [Microtetraspora malaysiensis]|uniref:hypothetical protein n=1 Tax=Microtetraspora malaysiensis TaxID=161358 RepID=UPI003D8E9BB0